MKIKKTWWIVFVMIAVAIDGLSYWFKVTANPISVFDVYTEYDKNHQDLMPMLFGPAFTLLTSYFIASFIVK